MFYSSLSFSLSPFLLHIKTKKESRRGEKETFNKKKRKHRGSALVQIGEADPSDKMDTEDFCFLLWGFEELSV